MLRTLDADILLWINGHHAGWLDEVMWIISQAKTWIWLYALLVLLLIRKYRNWKIILLLLAGMVVAVGLSDWICSGIIKPLVCRYRPTHEPALDPLHLVNNYIGGRYGFCSSHAANTMSIALLFSLIYRNKYATVCLMAWVALNCYSRMYLGVHYPSDIMVGLLVGSLFAAGVCLALRHWLPLDDGAARQGGS